MGPTKILHTDKKIFVFSPILTKLGRSDCSTQ